MGQEKYSGLINPGKGHFNGVVKEHWASLDEPLRWRKPRRVFVNSMSDLFHPGISDEFILEVFDRMRRASQHHFQVLTKRPERTLAMEHLIDWPDNVWMGTSVEDSQVVERIDALRQTGARIKFLSCEPLIGPLGEIDLTGIDWVIAGGESGPGARPMDEEWVKDLRDACDRADVAFFFKQWGGVRKKMAGRELEGRTHDDYPVALAAA
jgi:protein gp37